MKIKELIEYGKKILNKNEVDDSSIISRELAEYILQLNRQEIVTNLEKEVKEEQKDRYYLALIEIIQGMPIQYITNTQEFMKLNIFVNENVLIPQPDTEILVEEVIKIAELESKTKILDMCTGSGCIGVSLAYYLKNAKITMSDISKNAIEIAKKNAKENKVVATDISIEALKVAKQNDKENKIKFIQSDLFENINEKFDIIVSNPPYIETDVIKSLSKQVQNEPKIALDGGKDGLLFYRKLIKEAPNFLNDNGYLCMEIGYNQKEEVIKLAKQKESFSKIEAIKDLSGNDRVIICKI